MTQKLLYDQDGQIVTLTFDIPKTCTAITDHVLEERELNFTGQ